MQSINCSVEMCSHNNGGSCCANRVDIGGGCSSEACGTCCGSFLDKRNYGNLTNNTNCNGPCSSLVCKVESCKHNYNCLCDLSSINVSGNDPQLYTQTECASFENK